MSPLDRRTTSGHSSRNPDTDQNTSTSPASLPFVYHQVYALGDDDVPAATNAVSIAESLSEGALYIAGTFSDLNVAVPLIPNEKSSETLLTGPSKDVPQAFILKLPKPGLNEDDRVGFLWAMQSSVSPDTSGSAVASTILALKDGTGAVVMGVMEGRVEWQKPSKDTLKLDASVSKSIYVIRLNTLGEAIWGITIPLTGKRDDSPLPVACSGGIDEQGNIVVLGTFRGKVDMEGGLSIDSGSATTSAPFAARIDSETGSFLSISRLSNPDLGETANIVIGATASGADCGAGWIVSGCSDSNLEKECFVGTLNGEIPNDLSVLARWKVGSGLKLDVLAKVGTLNVVHRTGGQCIYVATGLQVNEATSSIAPSSYVKAFESTKGAELWSRDVTDPTNISIRGNRLAVGPAPFKDGGILISGAGPVSKELAKELLVSSFPVRGGFLITMSVDVGKVSSHRHLYRDTSTKPGYGGTPLALHALSNSTGIVLAGSMRGPIPHFDGVDVAPAGGGAGGGMSAWIAVLEAQGTVEMAEPVVSTPGQGEPIPVPRETPWTSFYLVFLVALLLLIPIGLCARKSLRPLTGRRSFPLREFGSGPSAPRESNERQLLEERFVDDYDDEEEEEEVMDRGKVDEERTRRSGEAKETRTAVGEHFRIESEDEEFF